MSRHVESWTCRTLPYETVQRCHLYSFDFICIIDATELCCIWDTANLHKTRHPAMNHSINMLICHYVSKQSRLWYRVCDAKTWMQQAQSLVTAVESFKLADNFSAGPPAYKEVWAWGSISMNTKKNMNNLSHSSHVFVKCCFSGLGWFYFQAYGHVLRRQYDCANKVLKVKPPPNVRSNKAF